jgi:iron complex outermembrane receptor protein
MFEDDRSGGVKANLKMKITDGISVTPGVSLFVEKYSPSLYENINGDGNRGAKIAENVENIFQANAYVLAEYVPDVKSFLSVSLNVNKFGLNDRNVFTSSARQVYRPKINFSPRISYSRQLITNHFVFGSISHGLSYPSVQEILYPDGTINSEVKPENAWSFEGGLKGIQLFNELKYSLAAYYMPVQDLIVPERIAEDTYIGRNVGRSLHNGLEVLIEKATPVSDNVRWIYLSNYRISYNRQSNKFREFNQDTINLKGKNLPGVPENKLFFTLGLKVRNWFFIEPELYLNGKTAMNDENTRIYKAYQIANLRFGFLFENRKWNAKLATAINNITDEKYASMILINAPAVNNRPARYYYPGLPRNYFFSVSIGYSL